MTIRARLRIAPGADLTAHPSTFSWTDITADLRGQQARQWGAADEQSETSSALGFRLSDKDGNYDPENPQGAYWPLWSQNCPIEFAIDAGTGYKVRCVQYLSECVPVWPEGKSKYLPRAEVTADGLFRRLGQGRTFEPALRRALRQQPSMIAGWTLEDANGSSEGVSLRDGDEPMRQIAGNIWDGVNTATNRGAGPAIFGQVSGAPGTGINAVDLGASVPLSAKVKNYTDTGKLTLTCAFLMDATLARDNTSAAGLAPGASPYTQYILWMEQANGGIWRFIVSLTNGTGDVASASGYADPAGPSLTVFPPAVTNLQDGKWHTLRMTVQQSAGNVVLECFLDGVSLGTDTDVGTLGKIVRVVAQPNQDYAAFQSTQAGLRSISNIALYNDIIDPSEYDAATGWTGELATDRLIRLCTEESVPYDATPGVGEAMGPQLADGLLANLRDISRSDFGMLDDSLGTVGYRSLTELYNQSTTVTVDAAARELLMPFSPILDDQRRRNSITPSLSDGTVGPTVLDQASIDAIGNYTETPSANLAEVGQLRGFAGFRLGLGLQSGYRFPQVTISPSQSPGLAEDVLDLPLGGLMAITNPPARFRDRSDIALMVLGGEEIFGAPKMRWRVIFNTVKSAPWQVGKTDSATGHLAAGHSTLAGGGWNGAAGSFTVATATGPLWSTAAGDYPSDVMIGGQRVTISAVSGASSPQTFTVSVASVNGIVKTHPAGTAVDVSTPIRLA